MRLEEILQGYINGKETGQDNMLRAAIGQLNAERTKELSASIQWISQQIPMTIV